MTAWVLREKGVQYMGHIIVWPHAPAFFLRGGELLLDASGDGYRDRETEALVYFQFTGEDTGLAYRLPGEMHRVKAIIRFPGAGGNRICPACGAVMSEEVSCPKEKCSLCIRHCRDCLYNQNYHCTYRTKELMPRLRHRDRARYILWHLKWKRRQ